MGNSHESRLGPPRVWVILFLSTGLTAILLTQFIGSWTHKYGNANHFSEWKIPEIQPVDPNTATLAELELIPGLGKKRAQEIIELRKNRAFHSLEDFRGIQGIGPKRLEILSKWLFFPEQKDQASPFQLADKPVHLTGQSEVSDAPFPEAKSSPDRSKLDPNRASPEELVAIPGIGPKLAAKIVETREISEFQSLEDLVRVPGIGKKNLKTLKPYFEISP